MLSQNSHPNILFLFIFNQKLVHCAITAQFDNYANTKLINHVKVITTFLVFTAIVIVNLCTAINHIVQINMLNQCTQSNWSGCIVRFGYKYLRRRTNKAMFNNPYHENRNIFFFSRHHMFVVRGIAHVDRLKCRTCATVTLFSLPTATMM